MRWKAVVGALLAAVLAGVALAGALSAHAEWVPTGMVTGVVHLDGEPLAGVEVWLGGDRYTCTGADGTFAYKVVANEPFPAATGPSLVAGCANAEFLDPAGGLPLVAQYYDHHNGAAWDTVTVRENDVVEIRFDVVRAAATQLVELQSHGVPFTGADWVLAFDRSDQAFVAAFGRVPRPPQYAAIWSYAEAWPSPGVLGWEPVRVPWNPPGATEVRYASVTDVLLLAKEGAVGEPGDIVGRIVDSHSFRDTDSDGVLEGPTLYLSFH